MDNVQIVQIPKIALDYAGLVALAKIGKENGRQDAVIDVLLQWVAGANAEISRLRELLEGSET